MNVAVYFTPLGLNAGDLAGRGVVVIDVLRATTSVIAALANGAKAVIPAATSEEAVRLASNLEKDGVLLAGERKVLKIEGFALGNSPRRTWPATWPSAPRRIASASFPCTPTGASREPEGAPGADRDRRAGGGAVPRPHSVPPPDYGELGRAARGPPVEGVRRRV